MLNNVGSLYTSTLCGINELHKIVPLKKIKNSSSLLYFGIPKLCIICNARCYHEHKCDVSIKDVCIDCLPQYIKISQKYIFEHVKHIFCILRVIMEKEVMCEDIRYELLKIIINLPTLISHDHL
jgi:hypothetical protein